MPLPTFSSDEVVQFAMNGEKLASGVKHSDHFISNILRGSNQSISAKVMPRDQKQIKVLNDKNHKPIAYK